MLLTLSQPSDTAFGGRSAHEFARRQSFEKSRTSPRSTKLEPSLDSLRVSVDTVSNTMANPHRGLPPPSAMNLPDPSRQGSAVLGGPLGPMPQAPSWQGQEESMRTWLVAKAEEEKRKQEEEKTRQESFRLEQRRIEQSMLRESLQAGIPPTMVPLIYAGIGGGNLAGVSVDWLQQYAGQLQLAQQQIQQHPSPGARREAALVSQAPGTFAAPAGHAQQQASPAQASEPAPSTAPLQTTFSAYQPAAPRATSTSALRSSAHASLPRLTTNEMYVHHPPQSGSGSAHPLQQTQTLSQDQHHWVHWQPPGEKNPPTPATKDPQSAHPGLASESDFKNSPRKRKAQGGHQPNPPPATYSSPSFSSAGSATKRGTHARSRSTTSTRDAESRPDSRREPEPPRTSHPEPVDDKPWETVYYREDPAARTSDPRPAASREER